MRTTPDRSPTHVRKKINYRQWFHRLIHRKCWNCNVALVAVDDRDGCVCPTCRTFYGETVMVAHERQIRARWWSSPWNTG